MANTNHLTPLGGYSDAGAQMLRKMSENASLLTDFLRFQGRVFKHPASVALEFFTQQPDATFIATAAQWEKAGFSVTLESSGTGGGDADAAHLPDDGAVSRPERVDVPGDSRPAVRAYEPAPEQWVRSESPVGTDEGILHGRSSDAGARAGVGHQTVKENTEEPSTDSAGGFSMPPASEQLRLFGMETLIIS